MDFANDSANVFVPDDGLPEGKAIRQTTHLGIGAHQDDLEIMAYHGILSCFDHRDRWFTGVTMTTGVGPAREGPYGKFDEEELKEIRRKEQRKAAVIGNYGTMIQLDYESSDVRDSDRTDPISDLTQVLRDTNPEVVYTHNPADKHPTHVAVTMSVLTALRNLPEENTPETVYGCEVWRDLDWLPDDEKVVLDVGGRPNLASSLIGVFDSQISGGKRYDLATTGRRRANATYLESHETDDPSEVIFAMDLTPLVEVPEMNVLDYVRSFINSFSEDVCGAIQEHKT